ncbi:hydrogenase 4 subunit B [Phenylobacterium sp.]|uniref:hydrogenase 4 subunit B n=1 Tax=Phenylobacterium sp. TaxID=1871053 RepID=UPI00289C157C|nr:hydrogenase 4 subunit B [Phenylobacterium sp.]
MIFGGLPAILGANAILLSLGVVAGVTSLIGPRRLPIYPLCAAVGAIAAGLALAALLAGDVESVVLPLGVPWIGAHFRIDPLAALFLVIVNLGGCAASVYAIGYDRHETSPGRVTPFYPAFLAGMSLAILAGDAFTFLVSWEFMSLMSWALVMAHHKAPGVAFAGYIYLVMASFGALALLLAFGLLAGPQGHYDFDAMRAAQHPLAGLILILALIGAGSKAGLIPLHAWLPLAHPAAPSHVSALMSGVMTKVAVYAFVRIAFDLIGQPQWWWSLPVLTLGAVTAVVGLLYALIQEDLKRLLAYSTIENLGVIFMGLGLALAFKANDMPQAAALAMTAALLHAVNHATFKSLLFFGAGSVLAATGQRSLENLGGLIRRMPVTSFAFLVGAAAICALPPLNGFVSEWLLFQAVLVSPDLPQWTLKFLVPAAGAMLALAAALAAVCFVRAFGVAFLGRPRSPAAETAVEVDRFQTWTMLVLALACLLGGVLPGLLIDALSGPVQLATAGRHLPTQASQPWLTLIPISAGRSSYNGLVIFVFIAFAALVSGSAIRALASRAVRRAPAWDCGFPDARPVTQYTASSFAQPLRRVFGPVVFQAKETVEMPGPGELGPARFSVRLRDLIWDYLYVPIGRAVESVAERLNGLQFLTIRQYLSLVFALLVLLLVVISLWR